MAKHALLSPSGAERWMNCAGSILAESTVPSRTSSYAEEGTTAHNLAALALESDHHNCEAFLGRLDDETGMEYTDDMCGYVQEYVDDVLRLVGDDKLRVEVKVDFSKVVGVPKSKGTADAVIVSDTTLQVHDLKYGRGVAVEARDNKQLMIYALGALEEFDEFGTVEQVTLGIHMPRKDGYNSWVVNRQELEAFGEEVKVAAVKAIKRYNEGPAALVEENLTPGEKQCQWCDFKAHCTALGKDMLNLTTDFKSSLHDVDEKEFDVITGEIELAVDSVGNFINLETVGKLMKFTDLVDVWVKAVRARVTEELEAGNAVPGYKLVRGRKGNRKWTDEDKAEAMLKSMRCKLDEMYNMKLISPTAAAKLFEKNSPKRFTRLQKLITRSEGAISVAPESDKRKAFVLPTATDDEFGAVDVEDDPMLG